MPEGEHGNRDLERMAKELYEAHATHNQAVIAFPLEHWEDVDPFTRDHWLHIARTAQAFGGGSIRKGRSVIGKFVGVVAIGLALFLALVLFGPKEKGPTRQQREICSAIAASAESAKAPAFCDY